MSPVTVPNLRGARASAAAISRWMRLIERYGGPAEALEALLRDSDRLEKLQRAVRSCGLDPEQLVNGIELVPPSR